MAMKDWKKDYESYSRISFINSKKSEEIQVEKTDYQKDDKKSKWSTFKFRNNKPIAIIKDVSKDKALAKAKSYMRKN